MGRGRVANTRWKCIPHYRGSSVCMHVLCMFQWSLYWQCRLALGHCRSGYNVNHCVKLSVCTVMQWYCVFVVMITVEPFELKLLKFHGIMLWSSTKRSFRYALPYLWNQLPSSFHQPHFVRSPHLTSGSPQPAHITSSQSSPSLSSPITASVFNSRLKTRVFHISFPS